MFVLHSIYVSYTKEVVLLNCITTSLYLYLWCLYSTYIDSCFLCNLRRRRSCSLSLCCRPGSTILRFDMVYLQCKLKVTNKSNIQDFLLTSMTQRPSRLCGNTANPKKITVFRVFSLIIQSWQ